MGKGRPKGSKNLPWEVLLDQPGSMRTLTEAESALQQHDGGSDRRWKTSDTNKGDGVTCSTAWICNNHTGCQYRIRAVKLNGSFVLQTCGQHTTDPNLYKSKRTKLTFDQMHDVTYAVDSGAKPSGIRAAMTQDRVKRLTAMGVDPNLHKYAEGGVIGVPSLLVVQRVCKKLKKDKAAGAIVSTVHELKLLCNSMAMPNARELIASASVSALVGASTVFSMINHQVPSTLYIPQDAWGQYKSVGACFTGPVQIKWIGQLVERDFNFTLHVDGKYKLHHGGWALVTLGTHYLRWDEGNCHLANSFAPLAYMFTNEHETEASARMLMDAVNLVAKTYFNKDLLPATVISDHSEAFRSAFQKTFPDAVFAQCWPHMARKFGEGSDYMKKSMVSEEIFKAATYHLQCIHAAGSPEMRRLLMDELGKVWDQPEWNGQMDKFWNSHCLLAPWTHWSHGDVPCMLSTPSNQTQESWHKQINIGRSPGLFRASTEYFLKKGLADLVQMDGLLLPDELCFTVPAIPRGMMENALWYIERQGTHVRFNEETGCYYILRKTNPGKFTRLGSTNIGIYDSALVGKLHARLQGNAALLGDVCISIRKLSPPDPNGNGWEVPDCEGNPMRWNCFACNDFKHYGICAHVLAVNHIGKKFNVRHMHEKLCSMKNSKQRGGNTVRAPAALLRMPDAQPDAIDAEQEKQMRLGQAGL